MIDLNRNKMNQFIRLVILSSLCIFSNLTLCQEVPKKDSIYNTAEVYPEYPGGHDALIEYISNHIDYPPEARRHSQQGTAHVKFVIKSDGHLGEVKILKSSHYPLLDKEAIRIVKSIKKMDSGYKKRCANFYLAHSSNSIYTKARALNQILNA